MLEEADLNKRMAVESPVAAFMAHHSLHHMVELELIFDQIAAVLHPEGSFVTMDMIGRNGTCDGRKRWRSFARYGLHCPTA